MELEVFLAFLVIQALAHALPHLAEDVRHWKIVQWCSRHGYVVWIVHPTVWHAVQDYVVHVIVYSGRVIAAH